MPKNSANMSSIKRRVKAFVSAQRRSRSRYRVLAEGDSWFTTPVEAWEGPTLIDALKKHQNGRRRAFNILSVANPSSELRGTLDRNNLDIALATVPQWLKRQTYDLVLLSTGGNDVLGTEMVRLLRDPTLDPDVQRCHDAAATPLDRARCLISCAEFKELLDGMEARLRLFRHDVLRPNGLAKARILIHGYDYPIPDGRRMSVLGGLVTVGPWLKPVFEQKNTPPESWHAVLKLLVDMYNAMLRRVAKDQRLFHYLDLRGALDGADDWADEIHPHKDSGIQKIAERMAGAMERIRDGRAPSIIGPAEDPDDFLC